MSLRVTSVCLFVVVVYAHIHAHFLLLFFIGLYRKNIERPFFVYIYIFVKKDLETDVFSLILILKFWRKLKNKFWKFFFFSICHTVWFLLFCAHINSSFLLVFLLFFFKYCIRAVLFLWIRMHKDDKNMLVLCFSLLAYSKNGRADTDKSVRRSMKAFKPIAALIFGWVRRMRIL